MRVDTTSPGAARPEPGTLWVWEPRSLTAVALIEVTGLRWDGKEWRVGTRIIAAKSSQFAGQVVGEVYWNDLSRFWAACHRVAQQPGLVGDPKGIRRGPPHVDEWQPDVDRPAR